MTPDDAGDGAFEYPDHEALIASMVTFASGMPITAELSPLRGPFGDVVGVELTDLYADEPGNGAGTAYMTQLVEEAETAGIALYLRPDSGRSKAFYERFGFERTDRIHGGLARLPSPPAWIMGR